jgi:hypothetical protein
MQAKSVEWILLPNGNIISSLQKIRQSYNQYAISSDSAVVVWRFPPHVRLGSMSIESDVFKKENIFINPTVRSSGAPPLKIQDAFVYGAELGFTIEPDSALSRIQSLLEKEHSSFFVSFSSISSKAPPFLYGGQLMGNKSLFSAEKINKIKKDLCGEFDATRGWKLACISNIDLRPHQTVWQFHYQAPLRILTISET